MTCVTYNVMQLPCWLVTAQFASNGSILYSITLVGTISGVGRLYKSTLHNQHLYKSTYYIVYIKHYNRKSTYRIVAYQLSALSADSNRNKLNPQCCILIIFGLLYSFVRLVPFHEYVHHIVKRI